MLANERNQVFDERKTWNLDRKNNCYSRCQAETKKINMNRQMKQLETRMDASKKGLVSFPYTAFNSDEKSFDPSNSMKLGKCKSQSA